MNNNYLNNPDHEYDKRTPLINFISNIGHTIFLNNDSINRQVQKIIQKNSNSINERDSDDSTPLHWAIFKGKTSLARLLLENGADVNARDKRYALASTPIHWAVTSPSPNLELVKLFLEFNADISITNKNGRTPMDTVKANLDNSDYLQRNEYNKIFEILEKYNNNSSEFTESEFFKYYSNTDECYICYEPLNDGRQVCVNSIKGDNEEAQCRHGFHCSCIRPWLTTHDTCPVCKKKFVLLPLGEMQQRVIQNSFGFSKIGIIQLNAFKKYLNKL